VQGGEEIAQLEQLGAAGLLAQLHRVGDADVAQRLALVHQAETAQAAVAAARPGLQITGAHPHQLGAQFGTFELEQEAAASARPGVLQGEGARIWCSACWIDSAVRDPASAVLPAAGRSSP
jgi:hypothetical protein